MPNAHDASDLVTAAVPVEAAAPGRALTPAARRALAEAEARRTEERARADGEPPAPPEQGGRGGLDPVRYSDWEIAGRAVDF